MGGAPGAKADYQPAAQRPAAGPRCLDCLARVAAEGAKLPRMFRVVFRQMKPCAWIVLALAASLGCSACLASTIWKWRDANGRVTVSDQPPPRDVPERDILERPAPRSALTVESAAAGRQPAPARRDGAPPAQTAASAAAARVDPELEARRKAEQAKALESAKSGAPADPQALARKRENCARARAQLASLDTGQRMARLNAKGERVILEDAERAQEANRAREIIAADCG